MQSPTDLRQQLARVLGATSPSYVISQGWVQLFQEFFSRGTRHETELLLPKKYHPATTILSSPTPEAANASPSLVSNFPSRPVGNSSTTAEITRECSDARNVVPIPDQGRDGPSCSNQIQTPISLSDAQIITPETFSLPKKLQMSSEKACRAIQAMRDAKMHDHAVYDSIWAGTESLFDNRGVEKIALKRYGRIQALQSRNDARGDIFKYAQRFSLLLGAHELEVIERTLPPGSGSRGVSLRSVAISKLAEHLHVEKRYILDENKRRSHYVSIYQQFGPGALLLLGDSDGVLSLWERDLNTADVELICKHATCHLRDWVEACKELNQKAGSLLIEGLHSCGWDGRSHRDTAFMKSLAHHFHLQNLHPRPAEPEAEQSTKRKDAEEEALQNKRHCHNRNPEPNIHPEHLVFNSTDELCVSSEDRLGPTQADSSQELVDATLDWDFSINLDLDWDQLINDQMIERTNG